MVLATADKTLSTAILQQHLRFVKSSRSTDGPLLFIPIESIGDFLKSINIAKVLK